MSRIGKMPIQIPDGVKVALDKNKVTVSGLRGEIVIDVPDIFDVNFYYNKPTISIILFYSIQSST